MKPRIDTRVKLNPKNKYTFKECTFSLENIEIFLIFFIKIMDDDFLEAYMATNIYKSRVNHRY